MKFNVLWLGFAIPNDVANEIFSIDPMPAVQTHKFGWSFVRALDFSFDNVYLASSFPVQNFPIVNRLIFRGGNFQHIGFEGLFIGFINTLVLKHITRLLSCIIYVSSFIRRKKINLLFIHGLHSPYLLFGLILRFLGIRVVVVLTDPPGLVLRSDSLLSRFLKFIDLLFIQQFLRHVDAVVALSPNLVRDFSPSRPALIFPGILDSSLALIEESNCILRFKENKKFIIVYAGGLSSAYGVDKLIEAVLLLPKNISVQLRLFGRGDQVDKINRISLINSRIYYGGFLNFEHLIDELNDADLLVNPRPSNDFFSTHSFPSKLIEYIAIGCPVLTTRIISIPDDLAEHYYYIDDESVLGICKSIENIMNLPLCDIVEKCRLAKEFIYANYSEKAISLKISNFVYNL